MAEQVKKTINVNGRIYELRKDATDPTQSFPYQLMTPLNAGCTQIQQGSYCCWIRGIIPPRQGTIEKPMEVIALGFTPVEVPSSGLMHPNVLQSMHYYVANDENFMRDFAMAFLGFGGVQQNQDVAPVAISPFPSTQPQAPKIQPQPQPMAQQQNGKKKMENVNA